MHWVIMRVRILPPRHLSHTIRDALFVVVGVLAGLARRIVPRVLCVQLLETIALTVCGFPPLSYARPRPRLRVRLDVGHRYMSALILRVRINELLGHLLTIFIFIFPTARLSFLVRSCNFVSGL
ncbi:hypothetical protein A0H81_07237 [Grifola frondosa]|uniref:Uncharacterized protein n=1 Tax=Grifola frondosa TaxID=5627 RepID=A0A1C7M9U5_GRIFR|nr:hypothetical protein A0H81_07237 [Grifola frondosa]